MSEVLSGPVSRRAPFIVLAGNLGAGKTTLAKRLADYFGWWIGYESVADNPYLPDFYKDMSAWAFHLQVYFLAKRLRLHSEALNKDEGAVLDRSIYEDRFIFAEALREGGNIKEREFQTYVDLFEATAGSLPLPDLFVFVSAPIAVLIERIAARAQSFDRDLPQSYLELIARKYAAWVPTLPQQRLLIIDSTTANFANDSSREPRMAAIFKQIADMLKLPDEGTTPAGNQNC
jgi:deoxyadenosine/deoxycytidine kinase